MSAMECAFGLATIHNLLPWGICVVSIPSPNHFGGTHFSINPGFCGKSPFYGKIFKIFHSYMVQYYRMANIIIILDVVEEI